MSQSRKRAEESEDVRKRWECADERNCTAVTDGVVEEDCGGFGVEVSRAWALAID